MQNPLFVSVISDQLREFLGEFCVEAAEFSVSYVLKCSDGRKFYAESCGKLLDFVESAYNEYLKKGE
jgi:hypothetical protein